MTFLANYIFFAWALYIFLSYLLPAPDYNVNPKHVQHPFPFYPYYIQGQILALFIGFIVNPFNDSTYISVCVFLVPEG